MERLELNIQLFAATATITHERNGNYDVENNNEIQKITFTVKRTSGTTYWSDEKTLTFRLTYNNDDGTTTTLTQSVGFSFPAGDVGATRWAYVYFTVPHKTDGTQSITYEASIVTGTSVGTLHPTGSATPETIPRASSITVNDANIGSSTNIVINKASSSFTTTLKYKAFDENSWTTIVTKTSNQVYGWTIPTSFYNKIPNSKTMTCQFQATTYSGDTQVGNPTTTTATFTATGNPVINSITATDVNSTTANLTEGTSTSSKMVRYASNVRIVVSASGQNSATISSIKVNGVTASNGIVNINGASTNSFQVIVTDSRGYTTSQTKTMTMVDYIPLTLNATIKRNTPIDGKVNITFSGNYFNGSFGNQNNTLVVQYRYKLNTSSTWGNWTALTPTINGNTYSGTTQLTGFTYTNQYDFEIKVVDEIQTKTVNGIRVPKGEPVYWWNESGFYVIGDLKKNNSSVALNSDIKDATLTIQKNGTTIDTFSANASSNKTINISVPTKSTDFITKLWENTNLTSFAAQSITLNQSINNYAYYEIIYKINTSQDFYLSSGKIPVGLDSSAVSQDGFKFVYRYTNGMSGTTFSFYDCRVVDTYGGGTTLKNDSLIPYRILGYK